MSKRLTLPALRDCSKPGWQLWVEGSFTLEKRPDSNEIDFTGPVQCRGARLESKHGTWSYGQHPDGYDTWWFAEEGGGGAITLPYAFIDGELWVGLIVENRPNMGGPALCAMGGFKDPGEDHISAAAREGNEEVGLDLSHTQHSLGSPVVSNRAFFVANPGLGEGVHAFALEVPRHLLRESDDPQALLWDAPEGAELKTVSMMPWWRAAAESSDALALAAIARLAGKLRKHKRE